MEVKGKQYILHGSRATAIRIWNFADIHYGARACSIDRLKKDIREVRDDPNSFFIIGGDYADFIGYKDAKRFDPDAIAETITVADLGKLGFTLTSQVRDLFKPIAHKCLGILCGNHERAYALHTHTQELHGWLCSELGVPNLGYCCIFDLVCIRASGMRTPTLSRDTKHGKTTSQSFRVFAHHGAGFAQTPGGKLNRLVSFMKNFDADIYFCGHVHDAVARHLTQLGANDDCTQIQARQRLGIVSGSYLKTYAEGVCTYGEQKGYEPVALGARFVTIVPETRELRAEI
jgi:hypothetical protein